MLLLSPDVHVHLLLPSYFLLSSCVRSWPCGSLGGLYTHTHAQHEVENEFVFLCFCQRVPVFLRASRRDADRRHFSRLDIRQHIILRRFAGIVTHAYISGEASTQTDSACYCAAPKQTSKANQFYPDGAGAANQQQQQQQQQQQGFFVQTLLCFPLQSAWVPKCFAHS